MTSAFGQPVEDNQNSMTAGPRGPSLLQDQTLVEKLAKFDSERIPERVVHAQGAGAHGYFEVTQDVTKWTKAHFLGEVGRKTPLFTRFSIVAGERGSADVVRDPRGFAVKHYTEEGIYDMVGNNTPVFFIRDAIKFPDFIHTQKPHPKTGRADNDAAWDFWVQHPEAFHQLTVLFSDRGTPVGYRHMNGYSSHTYKWVNAAGEAFYVQYTYKPDAGIKNFTAEESAEMSKTNPAFSKQDLYEHIESGNVAAWTMFVQIMPEADADTYEWDVFDITKVWPHKDYPLQEVGRMVLNRNPENWFAEVEQSAFSPNNLVPGVETSNCKMLQGRLFSYPDTHRHRLGRNYDQIPINHSYRTKVNTYQRDGESRSNGNFGSDPVYEPNTRGGPKPDPSYTKHAVTVTGKAARYAYTHSNCDYAQPRKLFESVFDETMREHTAKNAADHMKPARKEIQQKAVAIFNKISPDYGARVAKHLGVEVPAARL